MAITKSIIRTDSLSTDRLDNEVDDDLILCPICTNILWKPITCKTCENSFCLKCIRLWLNEKPNTCPFNCSFEERKPPPILIKLLSKLKLNCRHQPSGCTLSIPYEGLEKHELHECQYRITQCPGCLQEMLKTDFNIHEKEGCQLVELTCLKCGIIYNQRQGHTDLECLKKQITTVKEKLDASEQKSKIMEENYHKMEEKYNRQQKNEEYAKRILWHNHISDYAPSAPVWEPTSPTSSEVSARETSILSESIELPTPSAPPNESLRISTITFDRISQSQITTGTIPNGYAGFNWENAFYMLESYMTQNHRFNGFANACLYGRKSVAFNGRGAPLSIFLSNQGYTFGLHSFEAISIYHENFKLSITSYRSNDVFDTKTIILTKKHPILIEIDWEGIDRIRFSAVGINQDSTKPETFALTYLNLLI